MKHECQRSCYLYKPLLHCEGTTYKCCDQLKVKSTECLPLKVRIIAKYCQNTNHIQFLCCKSVITILLHQHIINTCCKVKVKPSVFYINSESTSSLLSNIFSNFPQISQKINYLETVLFFLAIKFLYTCQQSLSLQVIESLHCLKIMGVSFKKTRLIYINMQMFHGTTTSLQGIILCKNFSRREDQKGLLFEASMSF